MKINIEVLFVIFLILINLLVGGFFIYLIFTIDSPDMHADISIVGYSKNDLKLQTKIDINNPNLFNLIVKDIKVVSETLNGKKFSSFTFEGGEVSGNNERSFSSLKTIELNGNLPRVLKNKITAEVGVIFFGIIEKNIPVELLVELSLDELLDDLEIPDIILHAGIKELLDDGILFNVEIEIDNPNNVELFVEDIVADLKTEEGINVGKINLKGTIDKRFKPLFSFTDGDFSQIKEFQHSGTGEQVKVVKSRFKPVFGLKQKNSPQSIWEVATR